MFTSWQVRCGIADYSAQLVNALNTLNQLRINVVPFDRQPHPRTDYKKWGVELNKNHLAHIQHEYSFFNYLLPWRNSYSSLVHQIQKPLVLTRHVSLDGSLNIQVVGLRQRIWQAKWWWYQTKVNPYATYLNKTIFEQAHQVIVLTARLKDHLLQRGITDKKIHVIPPGVPQITPATDKAIANTRAQLSWQDKKIIGQFGFIAPPKGHALVIQALAQLPKEYVYLVAGGVRLTNQQPFLDELLRLAKQAGLQERIHVTGFIQPDQIAAYIAACNVLVYPNTHADFSYSVVVGLAHQTTPIVASNIYSHQEIQAQSHALTLFETNNIQSLSQMIQEAAQKARGNFRSASEQYAQNYSWHEIAKKTLAVYEQALQPQQN